jgi:hypothetical protein
MKKYTVTFPAGPLGLHLSVIPHRRRVGISSIDVHSKSTMQCAVGDCLDKVNGTTIERGMSLDDVVRAIIAAKRHCTAVKVTFMRWGVRV